MTPVVDTVQINIVRQVQLSKHIGVVGAMYEDVDEEGDMPWTESTGKSTLERCRKCTDIHSRIASVHSKLMRRNKSAVNKLSSRSFADAQQRRESFGQSRGAAEDHQTLAQTEGGNTRDGDLCVYYQSKLLS